MYEKRKQIQLPMPDTREAILTHLLSEDLTAIDLEERLGINESAIRRHLNTLEQQNYVEHYFEKAVRGRPKKQYSLTPAGRKIFPQKTYLLFILLAQQVEEEHGKKDLEKLLERVADKFADRLGPENTDSPKEDRLKEFVESLDRFGFYPELTEERGCYFIKCRNCVFGDVIERLREQLCIMHKKIVKNVFPDCEVSLKKSRGQGDDTCVQQIKIKN